MKKTKVKLRMNKGMSYVELIVVLSIFAAISSVVMFKYGDFQSQVDIKNLASDIALQIVQAQKSSINGSLPPAGYSFGLSWKPAYGVYFDPSKPGQFIYFVDLNDLGGYGAGEALNTVNITKNNSLYRIDSYFGSIATPITNPLSITFKRPDSGAIFISNGVPLTGLDYAQITVISPSSVKAYIKIYPSGRVQIN